MVDAALLSRVKTMSPADRLGLIGAVWDTLSPADVPVTEEDKALLDVRLADQENNSQGQNLWSEVQSMCGGQSAACSPYSWPPLR